MDLNDILEDTQAALDQQPVVYQEFQTAVRNEKVAPDLLPYRTDLVQQLKELIDRQSELLTALMGQRGDLVRVDLTRLDLQRAKYIYKDYHRVRLRKLEQHVLFYLDETEVTPEGQTMSPRLSSEEITYAVGYFQSWARHQNSTTLRHFPDEFQNMYSQRKTEPNKDMVPRPDLDCHVFFRAVEDLGTLMDGQEELPGVAKDSLWAARYRMVQEYVVDGRVQLL